MVLSEQITSSKKDNPTWEIIGVLIGFIGTADQFPILLNTIFQWYLPDALPPLYRTILILIYFLILLFVCAWTMWGISFLREPNKATSTDESAKWELRRAKIVNIFRMFPISLYSWFIFKNYDVTFYDIFRRPKYWSSESEREGFFPVIARFFTKGQTIEIQYPRDFSKLHFKRTDGISSNFGNEVVTSWFKTPFKFLTLVHWFGVYWTFRHVLKAIFSRRA